MTNSDPIVTAIVSTYRAERYMRGCLEDLVEQTLGEKLEILVIDSASPENEGEIVREFQANHPNVRYVRTAVREETTGAFNRAIGLARGRYLTTANTDDRHRPDALELMARALDENPEFGIVYADSLITNADNERFDSNTAKIRYDWPDYTHGAGLSCCLFGAQPLWRRDVHKAVGLFSPDHLIANDQDMFLRIAWRFGAVHLRETLGLFLQRADSNSGANFREETIRDVVAVMRKYRTEMPIEEVFPGLRERPGDPTALASAWFELGNLSALGPYNDFRLALECYGRALAQPGASGRYRQQFSNNVGCVLHCLGLHDRSAQALAMAGSLPEAATNRQRIEEARAQGVTLRARQLEFLELPHPAITASRQTRGLRLDERGELVFTELHEQVPWDVYDGPNGVPVSASERLDTTIPTPPNAGHASQDSEGGQRSVLIVMYGWADSGGGTILPREVARALASAGARVGVFYAAAQPDPELPEYAVRRSAEDGVQLFAMCNRPTLFMDAANPLREIDDPRIRVAFTDVLHEFDPEVVHFYNLHNLGMSLPSICHGRGIPTVMSSNNYWSICPRLYLFDAQIRRCPGIGDVAENCANCVGGPGTSEEHERRAVAARTLLNDHIDVHLAVSERMRELYLANGVRPESIEVCLQQPPSVDAIWRTVGSQRVIRARLDAPLNVGYIGSVMPHKGVHLLVQAMQAFPKGPVKCVLHGDVDPAYASYLRELDQNGVIEFAGAYSQNELPARLASLDVVVVPSIWEDCAPFVVAEALAARAPVLGSKLGGIPDFIEPGRTGVLFEPDDADAIARAIVPFLEDLTLLGRMQRSIGPPRGFYDYLADVLEVYARVGAGAVAAH